MAIRTLHTNSDLDTLGRQWITHFMERNPRLISILRKKIQSGKAGAATPEQVLSFHELFGCVRKKLNIRAEDTWNMDETGVALGVYTNSRVFTSSLKSKVYVVSPEDRE